MKKRGGKEKKKVGNVSEFFFFFLKLSSFSFRSILEVDKTQLKKKQFKYVININHEPDDKIKKDLEKSLDKKDVLIKSNNTIQNSKQKKKKKKKKKKKVNQPLF
ncbi:hypothetical protein DDB_G0280833 [Dictyostelium discoideum AX4]|uniref:Uncharacterized protein n=1 Tax=Dictyostelium discoideum TaxID=44689 RepID=Q54UT7_DICDI|nr:hypothetical protein DDB_G0280833 [Dictyostelium discoideum AX4]EAL67028.1 hypothetical protein DDB_G0280833 [Dictyostelium discoideum AX4]|eukprot:XP_641004.1 hypothetical protein DDB_G0280833 [Dictyostelium discoideum AX4]